MSEAALTPGGEEGTGDPSPSAVDISIVIVTWNSERWIERCMRSIPRGTEGLTCEVVLHDNGSRDGTLRLAGEAAGESFGETRLRVLQSPSNRGFAGAVNAALETAGGRYLFLLNPDSELAPGALKLLVDFLDAHPGVAGAAPLLVDERGVSQREFQLRRLPTFRSLAAEVLLLDKLFPKSDDLVRHRYRDLDLSEPRVVEQPAAAALLLRRELVDAIGPMDEQFAPAWFEDVDYSRRMRDQSLEIWVVPEARVTHRGGASLEHLRFAGFADIWYRNMWLYARKWLRPAEAEALRWAIVAGMVLRAAAGVVGFHPHGVKARDAFRAYGTVIRSALRRWGIR